MMSVSHGSSTALPVCTSASCAVTLGPGFPPRMLSKCRLNLTTMSVLSEAGISGADLASGSFGTSKCPKSQPAFAILGGGASSEEEDEELLASFKSAPSNCPFFSSSDEEVDE